jgi:hypothetical protein
MLAGRLMAGCGGEGGPSKTLVAVAAVGEVTYKQLVPAESGKHGS